MKELVFAGWSVFPHTAQEGHCNQTQEGHPSGSTKAIHLDVRRSSIAEPRRPSISDTRRPSIRMENSIIGRRIVHNLRWPGGCARAVPDDPPPSLHSNIGWLRNFLFLKFHELFARFLISYFAKFFSNFAKFKI